MTYIEEFTDDYKLSKSGTIIGTAKSAKDKFMEWQKSFSGSKKPTILFVQKVKNGIFVVYEKRNS